jgi:FKBP-type peptidyl-prolyl cis-trans isomerase (trigger factor)
VTREEIEQKMDELAREYTETHDPEIADEIYRLARLFKEMDH